MNSSHRLLLQRVSPFLAMGLWLVSPALGWSQSIVSTIPVGPDVTAIAINTTTNKIYLSSGSPTIGVKTGIITIVDGVTLASTSLLVGGEPAPALAVNEVTNKIYVAVAYNGTLTSGYIVVIDGATNTTTTISDSDAPQAIAVNPSTNKIYVANCNSDVTVIDGATNSTTTITDPNASGLCPTAIAVNPLTNKIYVANYNPNSVSGPPQKPGSVTIIDGATNSTTTITDPAFWYPHGVAVDVATNKVYVTNGYGGGTPIVMVIDGVTNGVSLVSAPDAWPPVSSIAVNSQTNKIYVLFLATTANNYGITVIDGATNATTMVTDPNARYPISVAVNEKTDRIYVTNGGDSQNHVPGSVTVLNGSTNATATLMQPEVNSPWLVAVNSATDTIYVTPCCGIDDLTVIDGAVKVPDLGGLSEAAASNALVSADLALGPVTQQSSSTVAGGNVISQNPQAGANVAPGSAISVVISSGTRSGGGGEVESLSLAALLSSLIAKLLSARQHHRQASWWVV